MDCVLVAVSNAAAMDRPPLRDAYRRPASMAARWTAHDYQYGSRRRFQQFINAHGVEMTREEENKQDAEYWLGVAGNYRQERDNARAENERLCSAIKWALGEGLDADGKGFGEVLPVTVPGDLLPRFWWRTQLRRMAGMGDLAYDKARRTIVNHQQGTQPTESK